MPREAPVTRAVLATRSFIMILLRFTVGMSSGGGLAAVHADDLARDERGLGGCREQDGVRKLLGASGALHRNARNHAGFSVSRTGEPVEHRGLDRTRSDRVDADPEVGGFERGGLGEALDGVFAGDVEGSV